MSQYTFHCQDCDKEFTRQLHPSDVDKAPVACPHCGSKRVHQLVSAFSAVTQKRASPGIHLSRLAIPVPGSLAFQVCCASDFVTVGRATHPGGTGSPCVNPVQWRN